MWWGTSKTVREGSLTHLRAMPHGRANAPQVSKTHLPHYNLRRILDTLTQTVIQGGTQATISRASRGIQRCPSQL
jgi:hypothetical protein